MFTNDVEPICKDTMLSSSSGSVPEPQRRTTQGENKYKSGIGRKARLAGKNLFNCEICGKDFSRKEYLEIHHKYHSTEKPFMCKICGRNFDRSFPLKKHQKTHETARQRTEVFKANMFKCNICLEKLSDNSSLLAHYSSKHSTGGGGGQTAEAKPQCFPCHICGKIYKKDVSVKRHILIHKRKPFYCDICKRNFVLDHQLQAHRAKHCVGPPATGTQSQTFGPPATGTHNQTFGQFNC